MATGDDLIHSAWDDAQAGASSVPCWNRPFFWIVILLPVLLLPVMVIGFIFFSDAMAVWGAALLDMLR